MILIATVFVSEGYDAIRLLISENTRPLPTKKCWNSRVRAWPIGRYIAFPEARGIGAVRYSRLVPKDGANAKNLQKPNHYNERFTWVDLAQQKLGHFPKFRCPSAGARPGLSKAAKPGEQLAPSRASGIRSA